MKTKALLVLGLVAVLGGMFALAQQDYVLKAKIDFPFKAANKMMQPGEYTFTPDAQGMTIHVQGPGKNMAVVPVLTRMASEIHTTAEDSHISFDVIGNEHVLAEIWIPTQDGYMLQVTKGPHKHKVINVTK